MEQSVWRKKEEGRVRGKREAGAQEKRERERESKSNLLKQRGSDNSSPHHRLFRFRKFSLEGSEMRNEMEAEAQTAREKGEEIETHQQQWKERERDRKEGKSRQNMTAGRVTYADSR